MEEDGVMVMDIGEVIIHILICMIHTHYLIQVQQLLIHLIHIVM